MSMRQIVRYTPQQLFFVVALCAFLGFGLMGCALQAPPKVYRVGIVSGIPAFDPIADGFKSKMAELGYVEGKNISYDFQSTMADASREQQIIKKFVDDKVDLIFALPTEPAVAAKAATQGTNIPVVFAMSNLEGVDLVNSVREPGGNITGARYPGPDLAIKRLELLQELAPQAKRVGIIYNSNYPANASARQALLEAIPSMGVTLVDMPITSVEEIQTELEKRAKANDVGMDAILIMPDNLTQSPPGWALVTKFAADHKLPIAGSAGFEADSGAIFSYIPDNIKTGALVAPLADKILKGTPAGTIPVVTPESELRINYRVAQALGLTVPDGIMKLATEIIR